MGERGKSVRLTRRFMLGALLGGAAGTALGNAPTTSIRPVPRAADFQKRTARAVEDLIAQSQLTGKIGFAVADAATGELLEVRNPLLPLPPASVTKSVTALYALDTLGAGHRFKTRLVAQGEIVNGRLNGDLVLVGGADPTLDTDALGDMARDLKAAGVREISGAFRVDSNVLPTIWSIDPDQPDHMGYNPTISGLNLNYNRVHFEWKRSTAGYDVVLDARARRYSPQVDISRMRVVERVQPVYTYTDAGGADEWTVARQALGQGGSRWLPVRKPELYAAEVFQTLARSHGIVLPRVKTAEGRTDGTVLVERESPDLRMILQDMLRYSTNLTAEVVGLTATAARGGGPVDLRSSAEAMSEWMQGAFGLHKARFVDHSGLGDTSRVTATEMVKALVQARGASILPAILKSIPMRDKDGKPIAEHPIQIRAKTGTLNFVSALSGYMTARDGREMAFAIFSADMDQRMATKSADGDIPPGSRTWKARARRLQLQLIERWGTAYTA